MNVKAAVVQAASVVFDRARTLEKLERLAREAARGGAQLIVFPEAFVSGYPMGLDFGAVVGNRTPEGREQFRRYYQSAVDVPGPDTERLEALADELKVHLVIGVVERDGGTLYCSVIYVGPGRYIGKHRKVMPTAAERLVWGFGDGSTLDVYDTDRS
jgi:nitrilase